MTDDMILIFGLLFLSFLTATIIILRFFASPIQAPSVFYLGYGLPFIIGTLASYQLGHLDRDLLNIGLDLWILNFSSSLLFMLMLQKFKFGEMNIRKGFSLFDSVFSISFRYLNFFILLIYLYIFGKNGAILVFQEGFDRSSLVSGNGFLFILLFVLIKLSIFSSILHSKGVRFLSLIYLLVIAFLTGSRSYLFFVFMSLIILLAFRGVSLRKIRWCLAFGLAAFLIYGVAVFNFRAEEKLSFLQVLFVSFVYNTLTLNSVIEQIYDKVGHIYLIGYWNSILAMFPSWLVGFSPPLDFGRYITTFYHSGVFVVPMPREYLLTWGWPTGNLYGYLAFGLPGLLLFNFLAAYISVLIYKAFIKNRRLPELYFYISFVLVFGIFNVGPYSLAMFGVEIGILLFLSVLSKSTRPKNFFR